MGGIRKYQENYIPLTGILSRSQKKIAKEAIVWLLSKRMHTLAGIAEHFGMPLEIVVEIINELENRGRVCRVEQGFKFLR
ncbi:hypothetical protein [Desulfotruncus alcoholivorax]|uniref:hypothetical protein n=1 Tax=Desulfotruncus alcoholivorax TaxID=265477 RepID=UPI0004051452|nr:hypothetical protein [Desulfotruncus alcoholivorax]